MIDTYTLGDWSHFLLEKKEKTTTQGFLSIWGPKLFLLCCFLIIVPSIYINQQVYKSLKVQKYVMGEIDAPVGEVYHSVEGGNGELGFHLVSDGGRTPYRLKFRRPGYIYYQAFPEMIKGTTLSDAIVTMSSMNVIAGELDT